MEANNKKIAINLVTRSKAMNQRGYKNLIHLILCCVVTNCTYNTCIFVRVDKYLLASNMCKIILYLYGMQNYGHDTFLLHTKFLRMKRLHR